MFHIILSQLRISLTTLFNFRLNSVFTTDTSFGYILPLMFFIFDMQEEWTWNISNNHIIKSGVYKTKKHPNIFRYISTYICRIKKKKEVNDISTMKKYQMPNKWLSNLYQSVIFKPKRKMMEWHPDCKKNFFLLIIKFNLF